MYYLSIKNKLDQISSMAPGLLPYRSRVIVDDKCPGLRFVASSNGRGGNWVRRYKNKQGKMKQYAFSSYPDVSLQDARAYVESVRGQDTPTASCPYGEPTIGILIDKYLKEYIQTQRTHAAAAGVRSALLNNLRPVANEKLSRVTAAMLHELILTVKKRAPTVARLMRSELKQAWSYGLAIGLTNVLCPISSLTGGRFKPSVRDRVLSDSELLLIVNNLDIYTPALADVIIVCLYTGLRSGEAIAIHANEFETDDGGVLWLTIPRERMKSGLAHRVPVLSKARAVIEQRIAQHVNGYLFPMKRYPDKPLEQAKLSREAYNVGGDVKDWRLHDLRRTTRTNLQRLGCPFEVSEAILAHKLPGVSSVYARFQYNDEKIKWLKELANFYDKQKGA